MVCYHCINRPILKSVCSSSWVLPFGETLTSRYSLVGILIHKRGLYKRKWSSNFKPKTPSEHALRHFDEYYYPVYDKSWPSIRLALLSLPKYSALVNSYANDVKETEACLTSMGALDVMKIVRETKIDAVHSPEIHVMEFLNERKDDPLPKITEGDNVDEFMPTQKIIEPLESLRTEEKKQSTFIPENESIAMISDDIISVPNSLKVFIKGKGNASLFKPPNSALGLVNYYLLDLASVIAASVLDCQVNDKVIDLCAAPGGKSLSIMQYSFPKQLVCVDHSYSRLKRLKEMLRWYIPKDILKERIKVVHGDSKELLKDRNMMNTYDKVLVDVPCFGDRHAALVDENNVFRPIRINERIHMASQQVTMLKAALQICRPGGAVVYSTCTLSMNQNDGVVSRTLSQLENSDMKILPVDLSYLQKQYTGILNFFDKTRYGQLILPNVCSNFGPMYIAKLHKLV